MTAVYICECDHPPDAHHGSTYACRICRGCVRFTPDIQRAANANPGDQPEAARNPNANELSTSARLARAERERDEAAAEIGWLRDEREHLYENERIRARVIQERNAERTRLETEIEQLRELATALTEARDTARAEVKTLENVLSTTTAELRGLRNQAARPTPHLDAVKGELKSAVVELHQLRADYDVACEELARLHTEATEGKPMENRTPEELVRVAETRIQDAENNLATCIESLNAHKARNAVDHNAKRRLRRAADRAERDAREAAITVYAIARANTRQREIRVVRLPGGNMPLGALAGTDVAHPFVPDGHTGTSCMACFGWCTDFRHWPGRAVARG